MFEGAAEPWEALADIGRGLAGDIRLVIVRLQRDTPMTQSNWIATQDYGRLSEADCDAVLYRFQNAFRWLRRNDLVSVAAVSGPVTGPDLHLALACDLRILADDAVLAATETAAGSVPALTGTRPLVDLVGVARATELCLTGRKVDAAEAAALGLASRVVPAADLDASVAELAETLLAVPRDALVETKALLAGAPGRSRAEQEAAERAALGRRLRDLAGYGE